MEENYIKKKLIIVASFYPLFTGGAEYQMRLIADQLKDKYEIVFIYLGDVPGREVSKTYSEIIDGYKVYFLQSCRKWESVFFKLPYARRLYEILKKEKPDFVYQRVLKFMSYYLSSYQKKLGYKHFIHIADLFTLSFTNQSIREKINYYFFRRTLQNNPKFIVQTREQWDRLVTLGVTPELHIYNMHPDPDIPIREIATQKYHAAVKKIVWIGNLRPIKQLEVFLDMAEKYIDCNEFRFTVIGNVLDQLYAQPLLERMEKLSNLDYYSGKNNDFINQYILEETSLLVNTSESEGLSNVFIQGWLRGVPVLSLNSNPDGLFDAHDEFGLFCANTVNLLFDGASRLIKDEQYVEKAEECYENAKKLFSFKNIEKIKTLLRSE